MDGWISIHRKLIKHWIWQNNNHLKGWMYCLFRANHQDNKVPIGSNLVIIKRGQFVTSISNFANDTGMSEQNVRTFWKLLESDEMINKESTSKLTKITICKYDDYQGAQQTNNKQTTNKQQTNNELPTTDNNVKKEKNVKECKENIPVWDEFLKYALGKKIDLDQSALKFKYESWVENGWKDGNNKTIKNWKSKLLNTIPYIKNKPESKNLYQGYTDSSFD